MALKGERFDAHDYLQAAKERGAAAALVQREAPGHGLPRLLVRDTVAAKEPHFKPLYDWNASIEDKIRTVAKEMYGAQAVDYMNHHLGRFALGAAVVLVAGLLAFLLWKRLRGGYNTSPVL